MIIKKYVGKTESEATDEAKKELGQNIVVMNVRPMKKSGFLALFQSQKIEVTVALEEETEKPQRIYSPEKSSKPAPRKPIVDEEVKDSARVLGTVTQAATAPQKSRDIDRLATKPASSMPKILPMIRRMAAKSVPDIRSQFCMKL